MTSPATQEPCPKCGGRMTAGAVGDFRHWSECRECGHRWDYRKPPSQRAELLTQERVGSAVAWLHALSDPRDDGIHPVHKLLAAALLQHIAALTQRVGKLEKNITIAIASAQGGKAHAHRYYPNLAGDFDMIETRLNVALSQEPRNG